MKRTLGQRMFAHGGIYALSRMINGGIGFLLIPLYAHLIGDEGYGAIELMMSLGMAVSIIFLQGLPGAWFRLRFDQPDAGQLRVFESTIVWYLIASVVIGIGILSIFGESLAKVATPGVSYYPLGFLTVISAGLITFSNLYQRKCQAEQQPIRFAVFTAMRSILIPGAIIIGVLALGRGVQGKMEADVVSAAVIATVVLIMIRPLSPRRFSVTKIRQALAYGLPLVPHRLAGLANNLIDRLLINKILDLSATGVYSMGYKLASVGFLLGVALNQAFSPLFIGTLKQAEKAQQDGDDNKVAALMHSIARGSLLMIVAVGCCMICLSAIARELLMLVTTSQFDESWTVVPVVSAGILAWVCYCPFSLSVMYDHKGVRLMPLITGLAVTINIVANMYMIPRMGIMGAAWATLISNSVMALAAMAAGRIFAPIPHLWGKWATVLSISAAGLFVLWTIDTHLENVIVRFTVKILFAAVCVGLILKSTNCKPADLKKLLGKKTLRKD